MYLFLPLISLMIVLSYNTHTHTHTHKIKRVLRHKTQPGCCSSWH